MDLPVPAARRHDPSAKPVLHLIPADATDLELEAMADEMNGRQDDHDRNHPPSVDP